ncbi:MAG TPA: saccharopine dehydrogenase NADP-binding domain-containing protein [Bryobacteraceae bacterium]|nr:saccharopine dehydrogenase NADP-binding domain-containing protein [Bryobacteraceae bacterium]
MTRDFDVILYGATGFTGRQTVAYFKKHAPPDLHWAIAGRNRAKLEALNAGVPVIAADSTDTAAIDTMAGRTRVVLNTAGPFARYGGAIVDACVRFGTHYADITGETAWVRGLIDRYHAKAEAEGTRIVPFCGFDSIPSDIGAMLISRALGPETSEVKAFFKMKGGLNGGTFASAVNLFESGQQMVVRDLFLLSPGITRPPRDLERDPASALFDQDLQGWIAPFVMGSINTRVVRRSCQILGADFAYQEYTNAGSHFAASLVSSGSAFFEKALASATMRGFLKKLAPAPGQGPSEKTMNSGWFRCDLFGRASDGRTARGVISDQGDPGNRVTVKCLCESAMCLAIEKLPERAGVLTPSTALGDALVARLRARGMTLEAG